MKTLTVSTLALSLLGSFGCSKDSTAEASEASAASSGSAEASAAPAPKPPAIRPKNAAAPVVVLAEKVLTGCKWEDGWFSSECPAYKEWKDKREELYEQGKADSDLVSLLGDTRPGMRYLGAEALNYSGKKFETDAAMAGEVITAAENETDKDVAQSLGGAVASIDVVETKTLARVQALMADSRPIKLRTEIVRSIGFGKDKGESNEKPIRDLVMGGATSKDVALRAASLHGLMWFTTNDVVCDAWEKGLGDPAVEVVEAALDRMPDKCPAKLEAVLATVEKAKKPVNNATYGRALVPICDKGAPALKARVLALAPDMAKNSKSMFARADALRAVAKCDAEAGKTLAKSMEGDEAEYVRKEAKKIAAGT